MKRAEELRSIAEGQEFKTRELVFGLLRDRASRRVEAAASTGLRQVEVGTSANTPYDCLLDLKSYLKGFGYRVKINKPSGLLGNNLYIEPRYIVTIIW